jgi:hypothetical protein
MQQARAMQALVLLDKALGAADQKQLTEVLDRVGSLKTGVTADTIVAASTRGYKLSGSGVPSKIKGDPISASMMTGSLAKELNNVTWAGELPAAQNTVRAYDAWRTGWHQVQKLAADGKHDQAVALLSGNSTGEVRFLFEQVSDEEGKNGNLGTALKVNKAAQDELLAGAYSTIREIELGAPAVALVVWLLVIFGSSRLRAGASPERAARRRNTVTA